MKRQTQDEVVYGLYDSAEQAADVFRKLLAAGVEMDDISLLMTEDTHDRDFKMLQKTRTREGVTAGGIIGGALGGVLGGVISLGTAITGIGLVVVGPMLALAATGGLIGGLIGHGVPEEEAERLKKALHDGKAMVAVHLKDARQADIARTILHQTHAEELAFAG